MPRLTYDIKEYRASVTKILKSLPYKRNLNESETKLLAKYKAEIEQAIQSDDEFAI